MAGCEEGSNLGLISSTNVAKTALIIPSCRINSRFGKLLRCGCLFGTKHIFPLMLCLCSSVLVNFTVIQSQGIGI